MAVDEKAWNAAFDRFEAAIMAGTGEKMAIRYAMEAYLSATTPPSVGQADVDYIGKDAAKTLAERRPTRLVFLPRDGVEAVIGGKFIEGKWHADQPTSPDYLVAHYFGDDESWAKAIAAMPTPLVGMGLVEEMQVLERTYKAPMAKAAVRACILTARKYITQDDGKGGISKCGKCGGSIIPVKVII